MAKVSIRGSHGYAFLGGMRPPLQRWLLPLFLLFSALFCQNAGLYSATCDYLHQADMAEGDYGTVLLVDVALDDPMHRWLKGSRMAESLEGSLKQNLFVSLLIELLLELVEPEHERP